MSEEDAELPQEQKRTRREWIGHMASSGTVLAGAGGLPLLAVGQTTMSDSVFDVRRFGAKGDGKADDTAAAQATIDAALKTGSGGRVHFPGGRYRITRSLRIGSGERIDITGDGLSATLLHENDEHLIVWPEEVSCREVSVRHLRVESVGREKSPGTAVIACLGGVERSYFQHLLFAAGTVPVSSGIITERVADTTTLESVVMWRIAGVGLRAARGSEIRVIGGRILGDGSLKEGNIGIHLTGDNGGVHVVTTDLIALHTGMQIGEPGRTSNREIFITHATFDSSVHGLVQVDHAYTSIAGCWAASCDEEQILLDSAAHGAILSVSGGTIFNGGAYNRPGTHHGIVIRAGRFTLTGVSIRHNKGTGILLDGENIREYTITGCRIHDNGTGAVLTGRDAVVMGNVFARNGTHLIDRISGEKQIMGNVLPT